MTPQRARSYPALFVALFVGTVRLRDSAWQGSTQLHTLVETAPTGLAFIVGAMALVRFSSKKTNLYSFMGPHRCAGPSQVKIGDEPGRRQHHTKASTEKPKGMTVQSTFYYDSRNYKSLTILTSTNRLPLGLTLWGFVDLHGDQGICNKADNFTRYFVEYRLSRALEPKWVAGIKGLGLQLEYNDLRGGNNSLLRFGPTYKHPFSLVRGHKGWLQWRFSPVETDGDGGQASLIYFIPLSSRVLISGFADWNWSSSGPSRWVIEPQLNYKLNDLFPLAVEFRHNSFEEANPTLNGTGVAFGLTARFW